MKNNCKKHFKFKNTKELLKASFNHRRRHKAILTKDDFDILEWIVMHNLGHGTFNLTNELRTLFKLSLDTIDHSLQKLIKLGIIERIDTDIHGIPTTLYTMLPFKEDVDGLNDFKELDKIKRIYLVNTSIVSIA